MRNLIIVILIFLGCITLQAQTDTTNTHIPLTKRTAVCLSYFGQALTHPGYKVGFEYEFWSIDKVHTKKNGNVIDRKHSFFLSENISNYYHSRNHVGLLLNSEIGYRYIREKGFMYEAALGLGYFHTFINGDTYSVNDNNEVSRIPLAGQSNFSSLYSFGIGKDYSFKMGKPWAWHAKFIKFIQFPFGSQYISYSAVEFGLIYYLKCNDKIRK
ncbi:MAG: hypothetical protein JXA77_03070 [Bacteroidales bacterium]|nr:hypothetical protein [Bacteroidales bacterium]MBN2817507.1 hypothetical protein [Bacteroidales bacterium]